jgi:hypothetical protein
MKARRAVVVALTGLAILLAGAVLEQAGAAPIKWLSVQMGTHRFGHLSKPDAIVARAGPKDVGFECGRPSACEPPQPGGCGCIDVLPQGPSSFDVARNGSIWLLDELNHRLLVWRSGHPGRPVRSVRLPAGLNVSEFVLGPDGTIFTYSVNNISGRRVHMLYALSPSGRVRWHAPSAIEGSQALLRVGATGAVYAVGGFPADEASAWTPLTTPSGRPLPLAQQRRRTTAFQSLPGGLHLLTTELSDHEAHLALVNRAHKVVRAWRITGRPGFGLVRGATALVGGDLVVPLDVSRQIRNMSRSEHVVLRLTPTGAARERLVLEGRAVWGDEVNGGLRIGPDGRLYQLRTDPKTGVSIARYSLSPRKEKS